MIVSIKQNFSPEGKVFSPSLTHYNARSPPDIDVQRERRADLSATGSTCCMPEIHRLDVGLVNKRREQFR